MIGEPQKIHLIGICGTGMGGLACLLKSAGHIVSGSDVDIYPPMSEVLARIGIPIATGYAVGNLDAAKPDLVVVGNAVNVEVRAAMERNLPVISFPEAFAKFFLADRKPITITGTHGKTTTTALLSWILTQAGRDPSFLIGGAAGNFDAGFALGAGPHFVVEGDEFRSSPWDPRPKFLHYRSAIALVHNIEFDHADQYPDLQHVKDAFRDLVRSLPNESLLVASWDSPPVREVAADAKCRVVTYSLHDAADWRVTEMRHLPNGTEFSVLHGQERWDRLFVPLFGEHNIQNALAALVIAAEVGIAENEIRAALSTFKGVRRRQEFVAQVNGIDVIDDFAHHPTAVRVTLRAVRLAHPGRRLWAVFEPQTYTSRTNLLQEETIAALSEADCVIVAEPTRLDLLPPTRRLTAQHVTDALLALGKFASMEHDADAILNRIAKQAQRGDVITLLSPGAFGGLRMRLPAALQSNGKHAAPSQAFADIIHRDFEAWAESAPDRIALYSGSDSITYAELNARANRLAHKLRALGVERGQRVGVMLQRSADATAALLAVLKAGGAFVPMDPAYPRDRLEFMCRDSDIACLVSRRSELLFTPDARVSLILLDEERGLTDLPAGNPGVGTSANDLAFVVYTSGSTGSPNGVTGTHGAMMNRFRWMYHRYPFRDGEVASQRTPISFVDSIWETFGPLCAGIPTCIIPAAVTTDPEQLIALLSAHAVSRVVLVPSLLNALLNVRPDIPARIPTLTHWTLSGEAFPRALAERLRAGRRGVGPALTILNLYGSTEVAADATFYEVRGDETGATIPIGHPIDGVTAYVLDEHQKPVPDGEAGELYIGGACVSPGYLGRNELNRERFMTDPFAAGPNARMFKTGDGVRRVGAQGLEYLGRLDNQVKVRGVRIELGEVDAALGAHPNVRAAAAAVQPDEGGGGRLVAFVVLAENSTGENGLRDFLNTRLQPAMIPSRIITVAALPTLPSGKVDRGALVRASLPIPDSQRVASEDDPRDGATAPDATEKKLTRIFADALKRERVEATDDFFALGGDSLAALNVVTAIEAEMGISVPPGRLMEASSARAMAERLRSGEDVPPLIPLQPDGARPPIFFFHGLDGDVLVYRELALALGRDQPSYGLPPPVRDLPDGSPWRIEDLAAACIRQMRAVQPSGPYFLAGYSAAGTTAFEAARQLRAAGHEVGLLAILDHPAPGSSYSSIRGLLTPRGLATLVCETLPARMSRFFETPRRARFEKFTQVARHELWVAGRAVERLLQSGKRGTAESPGIAPWFRHRLQLMPERRRAEALRHREALVTYAPDPYEGRVTLFRVRGHAVFCSQDQKMGWSQLARGGVDVVVVPGGHSTLMLPPVVARLAAEIRARMPEMAVTGDARREE